MPTERRNMPTRPLNRKRVLCLETSSWRDKFSDQISVLPALELLHRTGTIDEFVHRHALVAEEFDSYLGWRMMDRRVRTYGTIYLAFHGSRDGLWVGERAIPLAQLSETLGEVPAGVVHLGSCSVLKNGRASAEDFLRSTRAKAISGYERDVNWLDSAALDIAWLGYIAEYQSVGTAVRYFRQRYASLIEYLKWDAVIA